MTCGACVEVSGNLVFQEAAIHQESSPLSPCYGIRRVYSLTKSHAYWPTSSRKSGIMLRCDWNPSHWQWFYNPLNLWHDVSLMHVIPTKLTIVSVSMNGIGDDEDGWTHVLVYLKQTEKAVLCRVLLLWQLVPLAVMCQRIWEVSHLQGAAYPINQIGRPWAACFTTHWTAGYTCLVINLSRRWISYPPKFSGR